MTSDEIVTTHDTEHPHLFALRGADNNFGIISHLCIHTFEVHVRCYLLFPDQFVLEIKAVVTEVKNTDTSEETHIIISLFYIAQFSQANGF